jgi:hypothetical protein
MSMNTKTIEEIKAAVIAECERVCEKGTNIFRIGGGVYIHRYTKRKAALMLKHDDGHDSIATVNLDGPCQNLELFHKALGLESRDAVDAEKAKSAKLVEALEEIQTTARGASGLGWRGNNIGNIAGRALAAHKEGESRD